VGAVGGVARVPGFLGEADLDVEGVDGAVGGRGGGEDLGADGGCEVVEAEFEEEVGHLRGAGGWGGDAVGCDVFVVGVEGEFYLVSGPPGCIGVAE
jgi:hypothetical protein